MFQEMDLRSVSLTAGEFYRRRELVLEYLAAFDTARLVRTFRLNAGLPSNAEPLGGWESEDCGLRGHFTGHFLSACARFAYAGGDERLREKAHAVVRELSACAKPNGFLAAFPEETLDVLEREEDRGVWAPYYTIHKILQGLVDCARYLDDGEALRLACSLAAYIRARFRKLSDWKIDGILRCTRPNPVNEFGGLGDALYQLYGLTRNPEHLETARLFDRDYFLAPLAQGNDVLTDLHANTHLPMILAAMRRYEVTGETKYRDAVLHFTDFLEGRAFANGNTSSRAAHPVPGGVSERAEHWGRYGELGDALTGGESESCCAHNAERILSGLFLWTQDAELLDRLAILKYNAVLNCASPSTGLSQYHQPMGELAHKTFSGAYDTFWCCTASGVEAMSELQKNIWFRRDDGGALLLNVWIPSQVRLPEQGLSLTLDTAYPHELTASITVKAEHPVTFSLFFRANRVARASVNGSPVPLARENGYAVLTREWHEGDEIVLCLQSELELVPLRGDESRAAVRHGDVLLAQKGALPLLHDSACGLESVLRRKPGETLTFLLQGENGETAEFVPLYAIDAEEYTVYCRTTAEMSSDQTPFREAADGSAAYQT